MEVSLIIIRPERVQRRSSVRKHVLLSKSALSITLVRVLYQLCKFIIYVSDADTLLDSVYSKTIIYISHIEYSKTRTFHKSCLEDSL